MQNLDLLIQSLAYIEEHLDDDLRTEAIASALGSSRSTLEKLFANINNMSVQDYIKRRRMMLAARCISERRATNILELAVRYGYSTNESFTRAFKDVWRCTPSEYRDRKYVELFPRYVGTPIIRERGNLIMSKKNVDISKLYDLFSSRKDCWFVCGDIKSLVPINEISYKAGDLAILESMNRMDSACGDEDMLFRIGGDEFCILTDSVEEAYARGIADHILQKNGEPIIFNGQEIPLKLYIAVIKGSGNHIKYAELYNELQNALDDAK